MKRIRSNYHALQVLKTADPELRKAILAKCKGELVKTLSECSLNLLRGNVKLTPCQKRKLRKYRAHLRKLADRRVTNFQEEGHCAARRFLTPTPRCCVANYRQSVIQVVEHNNMLRKMYLVSPDYLSTVTSKQHHVTASSSACCQGSESPKGGKETY